MPRRRKAQTTQACSQVLAPWLPPVPASRSGLLEDTVSDRGSDDIVDVEQDATLRGAFQHGARKAPWHHQVRAVARILGCLKQDACQTSSMYGRNFLVQHSTGSGKTASMALLAHVLRTFECCHGQRFALVLLLSDRVQLDRQLGDHVEAFLKRLGIPHDNLRRADGHGLSLAQALGAAADTNSVGCFVIVTTKQKFDSVARGDSIASVAQGLLIPTLRKGRVAIICEECHRSHSRGSATFSAVSWLFGSASQTRSPVQQPEGVVYIGFTATPDARTLRLFGRCSPTLADIQLIATILERQSRKV